MSFASGNNGGGSHSRHSSYSSVHNNSNLVDDGSGIGCQPLTGLPPSISKQGWFTELETIWPGQRFSLALEGFSTSKSILFHERSKFQDILVFRSATYGNAMVLDGVLQLTERDEFAFHEMMVHVPLFAHAKPQSICIVGGGDGSCLREILRHDTVQRVVLVEIDPRVIYVTKTFFASPGGSAKTYGNVDRSMSIAASFDDPRVEIVNEDAATYLENQPSNIFDVILSDTSDPVGPAESLFQPAFYESMHRTLKPQGIVCVQALCLWIHLDLISDLVACCADIFDTAEYASTMVPSYPCGQIGFILACKDRIHSCRRPIPRESASNQEAILSKLRWYSLAQHTAAFTLPRFVEQRLEQKYEEESNLYDENGDDDDFWGTATTAIDEKCFLQWLPCLRSWFRPTAVSTPSSRILLIDDDDDDDDDVNVSNAVDKDDDGDD
ncbi:hypothetical protein ACA910_019902 [Epithemia clementina (nom. ined.)]